MYQGRYKLKDGTWQEWAIFDTLQECEEVITHHAQGAEIDIQPYPFEYYLQEAGHTWKSYAESIGKDPSNFKRTLIENIKRMNSWIEPLGLEVTITKK